MLLPAVSGELEWNWGDMSWELDWFCPCRTCKVVPEESLLCSHHITLYLRPVSKTCSVLLQNKVSLFPSVMLSFISLNTSSIPGTVWDTKGHCDEQDMATNIPL